MNFARNKVYFGILGILSVVLVVLLVQTALGKETPGRKDKDQKPQTQTEAPAVLQVNAYPKVNALMNKYYDASTHGNTETLKEIVKPFGESDIASATRKSEFIEEYTNITCYTENGVEEGTYIVFATYDLKFPNVDTAAPGMETWFVFTDENGDLYINNDQSQIGEQLLAQLQDLMEREDVKKLSQDVENKFASALQTDPNLQALCEQMGASVNTETDESAAPSDKPDASTAPVTPVPVGDVQKEWMVVVDAEMFSEPKDGQSVGIIPAGTTVWVIQNVQGGFSYIEKDGGNYYVKTAYMSAFELVDQEITATVNYYASCSDAAPVMGTITSDQPCYCSLKFANGWGQIIIDGQKIYVKNIDSLLGGGSTESPSPSPKPSEGTSEKPDEENGGEDLQDTVDANENDE